jgi:hypothetical protein
MAVMYAIDTPEAFDAVVGDLAAYSQMAWTDGQDDQLEESFEAEVDNRAIKLVAVFLLVETVLMIETVVAVFLAPPTPGDPIGSLLFGLLGVALLANFVAGIAAGWTAAAGGRWRPTFPTTTDDWISIND